MIQDIFRKYNGYEAIIPKLCQNIDEVDEPNARGALIWIVGEYAEKINDADEILGSFVGELPGRIQPGAYHSIRTFPN
jgi:AP-1 complex subunit beta-1